MKGNNNPRPAQSRAAQSRRKSPVVGAGELRRIIAGEVECAD